VASFEPTGSYELLTSISIRLVEALSASGDDWTFLDFSFPTQLDLVIQLFTPSIPVY
jgi:hypothetical protein